MKHSICDFYKTIEGRCCTGCLMEGKHYSGDIMEGKCCTGSNLKISSFILKILESHTTAFVLHNCYLFYEEVLARNFVSKF